MDYRETLEEMDGLESMEDLDRRVMLIQYRRSTYEATEVLTDIRKYK